MAPLGALALGLFGGTFAIAVLIAVFFFAKAAAGTWAMKQRKGDLDQMMGALRHRQVQARGKDALEATKQKGR